MKKKLIKATAFLGLILITASGCTTNNTTNEGTQTPIMDEGTDNTNTDTTTKKEDAADQQSAIEANVVKSSDGTDRASNPALTAEEAKKVAFDDAKVTDADVSTHKVEYEIDDGVAQYNVEFIANGKEYDYEIDAANGKILSSGYEAVTEQPNVDVLTEGQAKQIVIDKMGGAADLDIYMKFDEEDGTPVYEGEFVQGDLKYEFEINAVTGELMQWESESKLDD